MMKGTTSSSRVCRKAFERRAHSRNPFRSASKLPSQAGEGAGQPTTSAPNDAKGPSQRPPIRHSRVYLEAVRKEELQETKDISKPRNTGARNAIDWMLKSVDETLNKAENNPPVPAKMAWDVARGPMGKAAGQSVREITKATAQTAGNAVKAAAPVLGTTIAAGARLAFKALLLATKKRKDKHDERQ